MSSSIAQNIEALCQEQGIERDLVIEAMKEAVRAAAKKQFKSGEDIQVDWNAETGIELSASKVVVDEVENPATELSIDEARELAGDEVELGDALLLPLPMEELGRIAAQTAKQILFQKVRDAVRAEMHPFDKNLFRTGARLNVSRNVLDGLWTEIADHAPGGVLVWREAAALVAAARWSVATAERRNESRGMHRREDFPEPKAQLAIRLLSGGLDRVWVAADGELPGARSSQLEPAL